ncbi:hypothetical protein [Reichenbachiella versicolor]|uniref:hypothetical protein n=1 Tax=Reichenbachiella versicolor TaxID=1821036 RepID=UPI000D6E4D9C|nr:hypothetical protein [Reichenbachiella versicolor]
MKNNVSTPILTEDEKRELILDEMVSLIADNLRIKSDYELYMASSATEQDKITVKNLYNMAFKAASN